MKTLRFKTSINCMGCLAKVTAVLNSIIGPEKWNVDINNKDKILTVESNETSPQQIVETLKNLGFKAEILD